MVNGLPGKFEFNGNWSGPKIANGSGFGQKSLMVTGLETPLVPPLMVLVNITNFNISVLKYTPPPAPVTQFS